MSPWRFFILGAISFCVIAYSGITVGTKLGFSDREILSLLFGACLLACVGAACGDSTSKNGYVFAAPFAIEAFTAARVGEGRVPLIVVLSVAVWFIAMHLTYRIRQFIGRRKQLHGRKRLIFIDAQE